MAQSRFVLVVCGVLLLGLVAAPSAQATLFTHVVLPTDNMYNTNWAGNPYYGDPTPGTPAQSVSSGGSPVDFSGYSTLFVNATGCVQDAGSACTGPNGTGGTFRGLPVYSMIGLWSSTGGSITAIGSAFFVGAANTLAVPGGGPAYLFLAENDGNFSDNTFGQYNVSIEAVPEPTTLSLMALGGLLFGAAKRRRRHQP